MRTSKIENKINRMIIEDSEVPDSVLDMAREKMRSNAVKYQIRTYSKKIMWMKIALIVLFCLWIPTIGIVTYQEIIVKSSLPTYDYSSLVSESIQSVEWYNETYDKNFLWVEDLPILESYQLKDKKGKLVLLEEHYQDGNHEVVLYIQKNGSYEINYNFDINTFKQNNLKVSCAYLETNKTVIRLYDKSIVYLLELDYIEPNIIEKLDKLFKNQSFLG